MANENTDEAPKRSGKTKQRCENGDERSKTLQPIQQQMLNSAASSSSSSPFVAAPDDGVGVERCRSWAQWATYS